MAQKTLNPTKERILMEASMLFATRSYGAVSVRNISDAVDIKASSLYNHFDSKEDILQSILLRFQENYIQYFINQKKEIQIENSLEKIMDIMFASLHTTDDKFMYYGIAIIMKEQFQNKLANEMALRLFYTDGIEYLKSYFDLMAGKKIINPCDSKAIATFFMFSVLIGTGLKIQESIHSDFSVNTNEIYQNLYDFIVNIVKRKHDE